MSDRPKPDYLFDIGNVILFFDFRIFARAVAPYCECDEEGLMGLLRDPTHEMEARSLPKDHFLEKAFELTGYRGDPAFFVKSWQEIFTPNLPVMDWIRRLDEAGHRLCLLSNTNQLHVDHFLPTYAETFDRFDGHVFSHEAGYAKPEPEIYDLAVETLGLSPEETFYLDDKPENVAMGREKGFQAVLYEGQPVWNAQNDG